MSSVREELIECLVEEFEASEELAIRAVDRAIATNQNDEDFGTDIEGTAEYIYDTSEYWNEGG